MISSLMSMHNKSAHNNLSTMQRPAHRNPSTMQRPAYNNPSTMPKPAHETLPDLSEVSIMSRADSLSKLTREVEKNWTNFLTNEESAIPRKRMAEKILSITLSEVLRGDPDFVFTIVRAGSARERLGTIMLNAEKLHLQGQNEIFKRPNLSSDADVMLVPNCIQVGTEGNELVEFVPSENWSMGHVYLRMSKEILLSDQLPKSVKKMCIVFDQYCYLSPILARDVLVESLRDSNTVFQPPTLLTALREHGPAIEFKIFEVSPYRRYMMEFLADFTLAFRILSWPACAQEWMERPRFWPEKSVVYQISSSGCHVVPIVSDSSASESRLDWRLSFSQAEAILADNIPENARKIYLVAKSIFKDHLKSLHVGIASYHLKVSFMRFLEQTDPGYWRNENLGDGLCRFLDCFYGAVILRQCPHLFVTNINLFRDLKVGENYLNLVNKLDEIRKSPLRYALKVTNEHSKKMAVGCLNDQRTGDHVHPYDPDVDNTDDKSLPGIIKKIIDKKMGHIPVLADNQPITIQCRRPAIPFLTGNNIVTSNYVTSTPQVSVPYAEQGRQREVRADVECTEDDGTELMMSELLELAHKEERRRRRMRALKELNCCHLLDYIPTTKQMNRSGYVIHVDADVEMSGLGSCRERLKQIMRFRCYFLLIVILLAATATAVSVTLVHSLQSNSLSHTIRHEYLLGSPTGLSSRNCSITPCNQTSVWRLPELPDKMTKFNLQVNQNPKTIDRQSEKSVRAGVQGGRVVQRVAKAKDKNSETGKEKSSAHSNDNVAPEPVDRDDFYSFKGMKAPELHADDSITNLDSKIANLPTKNKYEDDMKKLFAHYREKIKEKSKWNLMNGNKQNGKTIDNDGKNPWKIDGGDINNNVNGLEPINSFGNDDVNNNYLETNYHPAQEEPEIPYHPDPQVPVYEAANVGSQAAEGVEVGEAAGEIFSALGHIFEI